MTFMPEQQLTVDDQITISTICEKVGADKAIEFILENWLDTCVNKFGMKRNRFYNEAAEVLMDKLSKIIYEDEIKDKEAV